MPSIGPKEADKNVRNFSEEQLKAGQGIISLQYGSNKGANQSGINFGNTRHMWNWYQIHLTINLTIYKHQAYRERL